MNKVNCLLCFVKLHTEEIMEMQIMNNEIVMESSHSRNSFAFLITCLGYVINRTQTYKEVYLEIKIRYENSMSERMRRRKLTFWLFSENPIYLCPITITFFQGRTDCFSCL